MKKFLWILLIPPLGCGLFDVFESKPTVEQEIGWVLKSVQRMYGPPREVWNLIDLAAARVDYDFNGDGQREIVIFFTDEGLGELEIDSINDLRKGSTTCGFAMMTRIDEKLWPLFYYFNEYRVSIRFGTVANYGGLINEGGKGGMQIVWGWAKAKEFPARWESLYRIWDPGTGGYDPFAPQDKMVAVYGK